eukprot:jgi/Ulvmu1/8950/UM005_0041.1
MRGVNNRRQSESPKQLDADHDTIDSLVQALSSLSSSLRSSSHSSYTSNSSGASLSLNFTVPVPDSDMRLAASTRQKDTAAAKAASAASTTRQPRQRPRTRRKQGHKAHWQSDHLPEAPTLAAHSTRLAWPAHHRESRLSHAQTAPPTRANASTLRTALPTYQHRSPPSQVWRLATGQPNESGAAHVMRTSQEGGWRFKSPMATSGPPASPAYSATRPQLWRRQANGQATMAHATLPGHRGRLREPARFEHPQRVLAGAAPPVTQRRLAAIRTHGVPAATPSIAQLTELGQVMDEIIARMASSVQPGPSEDGYSERGPSPSMPLPQTAAGQADTQELSCLLQEAQQVMLALRQTPTICTARSAVRQSPLQNVRSWVEYSQPGSADATSLSQAPQSPLSHHSYAASPRPTICTSSDSEMLDFIPALSLPMPLPLTTELLPQCLPGALPRAARHEAAACVDGVAAVSASDVHAPSIPRPGGGGTEVEADAVWLAGRATQASKPGSSADTLPGPPATSFSASDSDAFGPSTPSNSFAQGSTTSRPAYTAAQTHSRVIQPVEEMAGSESSSSTSLENGEQLSTSTVSWRALSPAETLQGTHDKSGKEGEPPADAVQPGRAWCSLGLPACLVGKRNTYVHQSNGRPGKGGHRINDNKKNKEERMKIGCSCL